jgi:hypothetical protein
METGIFRSDQAAIRKLRSRACHELIPKHIIAPLQLLSRLPEGLGLANLR